MYLSTQSVHHSPEDVEYPGHRLQPGYIRLIRLVPGDWADPIRCEILESNLLSAEYQALSYVWGAKHVKRFILLENKMFSVTVNLESALRHLREQLKDDSQGAILWVDALCINQADDGERTSQVQMMRRIYERCRCVIAYLGDRLDGRARGHERPKVLHFEPGESPPSLPIGCRQDAAYGVFCLLQELVNVKHLTEMTMLETKSIEKRDGQTNGREHNDPMMLVEALRKMMQPPFTPWWSRIWTVQEVAVAQKVLIVYGTISAPWSLLTRAAGNYIQQSTSCCSRYVAGMPTDQAKVLTDCFNRILGIEELQVTSKRRGSQGTSEVQLGWSLLELLRHFRDRRATDPRDKVYALLSLVARSYTSLKIVPDYTLGEVEVFCQATLACIHGHENLSVFNTELGRKYRNDLPSWVPDWGAPGGLFYDTRAAATELYSTCPNSRSANAQTVYLVGEQALTLDGCYLESIVHAGEVMWGGEIKKIWRDTLWSWWEEVARYDDASFTDFRRNFWRLICGDVICNVGTDNIARRADFDDELTFIAWTLESRLSPNSLKYDLACSEDANLWRDFHFLWYKKLVSGHADRLHAKSQNDYFPHYRLHSERHDRSAMVRRCLKRWGLNRQLAIAHGTHITDEDVPGSLLVEELWLNKFDALREDAPWQQLFSGVKQILADRFGRKADISYQRESLPVINRSIMTATLSRRLIISGKYIGLGPANAKAGDRIFFLSGGKTPFVLRETDVKPTVPGRKFEIIGDCYLHGIMDWEHNPDGYYRDWEKITLL